MELSYEATLLLFSILLHSTSLYRVFLHTSRLQFAFPPVKKNLTLVELFSNPINLVARRCFELTYECSPSDARNCWQGYEPHDDKPDDISLIHPSAPPSSITKHSALPSPTHREEVQRRCRRFTDDGVHALRLVVATLRDRANGTRKSAGATWPSSTDFTERVQYEDRLRNNCNPFRPDFYETCRAKKNNIRRLCFC